MGIRGGRQAPLTTLKHLPFQMSQVRGTEHWNAVPKIVAMAQTPMMAPTTAASCLSFAIGVRLRMNTARDSLEHARLRM
jgi:hypothetical protein